MSGPQASDGSRDASGIISSASSLKKLYRKIWEYGKQLEHEMLIARHIEDIFKPDLKLYRKRFSDKCSQFQVLFLKSSPTDSNSYSPQKVEELLWKRGFYDVVQKCKLHPQAVDVKSTICQSYSEHINTALKFYEGLQHKLELEFGVDHSRLNRFHEDTNLSDTSVNHLKDLMYKVFIHLGDLARYQVTLGASPYNAVGFYHQAITLDPTIGTAYNQLAVLSGSKNECLDAIYYYQRSVTSTLPFSGAEANLTRLFEKNRASLAHAESTFARATEPDMREALKKIFLLQFIRIQQILIQSSRAGKDGSLNELCSECLRKLELCLEHDVRICREQSAAVVSSVFGSSSGSGDKPPAAPGDLLLLPPDLVLKLAALSILPSYSLRQLGSTLTRDASSFALSVLSSLLQRAFQCISHLVATAIDSRCSIRSQNSDGTACPAAASGSHRSKPSTDYHSRALQALESGRTVAEVFQDFGVLVSSTFGEVVAKSSRVVKNAKKSKTERPTGSTKPKAGKAKKGKKDKDGARKGSKRRLVVDRRRRRKGKDHHRHLPSSEDEENGTNNSSFSDDSDLSDDSNRTFSLSDSLGEDDLDLLNALSDRNSISSSSEEDSARGDESDSIRAAVGVENSSSSEAYLLPSSASESSSEAFLKPLKRSGGSGKRQIILAANFSMGSSAGQTVEAATEGPNASKKVAGKALVESSSASAPSLSAVGGDEGQFAELVRETDQQAAVYTACSLLVHEKSLMALRLFVQWLTSYPIVFATCTRNSTTLWSHLATLLNILPNQRDIASSRVAGEEVGQMKDLKSVLVEDVLLRGFPPLLLAQETLDYVMEARLAPIQEVCCRICSLQKFGHFLAETKTAPLFTWDKTTEKFVGPEQKLRREQAVLKEAQALEKKQAELNRSKLMKVMAQRKLQSEVEILAEASNKSDANPLFTPYLIPDANSLCTGLHIVKKLIKTEKFIFIIAKSVIEALDIMKKNRESYSARDVIKFLEKELHTGNKYLQAQKPSESRLPEKKRSAKTDMQVWVLEHLVDCACYFTEAQQIGSKVRGPSHSVATLILEKPVLDILNDPKKQAEHCRTAELLNSAQQRGVEMETMTGFHINWSKYSKKVMREK